MKIDLMERVADKAAEGARATRVAMYADWIEHDADGLAFNVATVGGAPIEGGTAILAAARARLVKALEMIDAAIGRDALAHRETEAA